MSPFIYDQALDDKVHSIATSFESAMQKQAMTSHQFYLSVLKRMREEGIIEGRINQEIPFHEKRREIIIPDYDTAQKNTESHISLNKLLKESLGIKSAQGLKHTYLYQDDSSLTPEILDDIKGHDTLQDEVRKFIQESFSEGKTVNRSEYYPVIREFLANKFEEANGLILSRLEFFRYRFADRCAKEFNITIADKIHHASLTPKQKEEKYVQELGLGVEEMIGPYPYAEVQASLERYVSSKGR